MLMIEWWNSLGLATQIFFCVALPSTLVLLVQTILLFLGIGDQGGDGVADGDVDADGDMSASEGDLSGAAEGIYGDGVPEGDPDPSGLDGLRIFTVRGVVAFLVVFGWVGVAMDTAGAYLWLTILVALISGFLTMLGLAFLMRVVMKLRNNGNVDNRNAVGTSGRVQLTVPPARSGEGKVHLILQGALVERNAVTDETEAIPTGAEIVVVGVSGQTDLVVKRK